MNYSTQFAAGSPMQFDQQPGLPVLTNMVLVANNVDSAATNSASMSIPAHNAGDVMMLLIREASPTLAAACTLAGWTNYTLSPTNAVSGTARYYIMYKISDGTETTIPVFNQAANSAVRRFLYISRGNRTPRSITISDYIQTGNSTVISNTSNPAAQVKASNSGKKPFGVYGYYSEELTGSIATRTFTVGRVEASDREIASGTGKYFKVKHFANTVALGQTTIDMPDAGTNVLLSYIARFT